MESKSSPNSLKSTLNWRDNAKQILETIAQAKTATLRLAAGETIMSRQLKRQLARQMGKQLVIKARTEKRSSARLVRSVLRRRKKDAATLNSTGTKHYPGRPVEFPPRSKSGFIQIGRLFHV